MSRVRILLLLVPLAALAGCGGSNGNKAGPASLSRSTTAKTQINGVAPSVIAECAHARSQPTLDAEKQNPQTLVENKVVEDGLLAQYRTPAEEATINYDLEHHIEAPDDETPQFRIYVFKNPQAAAEAFKLIAHSPKAEEEWGAGGTFQRANIVLTTQNTPLSLSLTATATTLLNKCSVPGQTQSLLRKPPNESLPSQTGNKPYEGEIGQRTEPITPSEAKGND